MYNEWAEDILLIIELVLPTAWDIEDKSPFIDIDSSGLKVNYTGNMKMRNLAETYLMCYLIISIKEYHYSLLIY